MILALAALVSGAGAYEETVNYTNYGFDLNKTLVPAGIELHSNADMTGMVELGLAYSFTIDKDGRVTRWAPEGSNTTAYNYTWLPVSYHAGKGVMFGNNTPENLNLKLVGIGLLYGLNETPTERQLAVASELINRLKITYPGISVIAGQTDFSGYRANKILVWNQTDHWLSNGSLMPNPWNFPMHRFEDYVDFTGDFWDYNTDDNRLASDSWRAEHLVSV
jgi:hypothetical protein